jgi:hypothetical protein
MIIYYIIGKHLYIEILKFIIRTFNTFILLKIMKYMPNIKYFDKFIIFSYEVIKFFKDKLYYLAN